MAKISTYENPPCALVGCRIVAVRAMSARELAAEGWDANETVPALVLDNGAILYPSRDDEGNGPGVLFGTSSRGGFHVSVSKPRG